MGQIPVKPYRVYIAGPMTGCGPDFNYPAFHAAALAWRGAGFDVLNPAESFGGITTLPYRRYMRNAIRLVLRAHAIALLPGWTESDGAKMEVLLGLRLGLDFYDAHTGEMVSPTLRAVAA